ncbi:hypothetical protein [Streptococcus sobrinus]|nr:hypothetical protein [Streptococcus sobrinus]
MMNRKDKKAKAKTGFLTWALVKVGITVMLITSGLIYGLLLHDKYIQAKKSAEAYVSSHPPQGDNDIIQGGINFLTSLDGIEYTFKELEVGVLLFIVILVAWCSLCAFIFNY